MPKDASGMRGYRSRNRDGRLRQKREDTHMGTVEEEYGIDFGVRSDMQLGTFLRNTGSGALSDLLKDRFARE